MISFFICLSILVGGYFGYGFLMEKVFVIKPNELTPAYKSTDNVDYIPLPTWKVFLIQFLNIAGLGPIFGAIMGILYGPAAFIWIVLGTIFAGAVHDYFSGMISIRNNGASLPEIVGKELGTSTKQVMRAFSILLMILVGAVFVVNPASLLGTMTPSISKEIWIAVIFVYYMLATLLPIDKIIGRFYPIFGFALVFMALGVLGALLFHLDSIPEFTEGIYNRQLNASDNPIFPMMFITIACGAISGFHATQSPMMARCIKNEKYGRPVFYGAMVAEGIVALIWAAAAIAFKGTYEELANYLSSNGGTPAMLVNAISRDWLGVFGGFLVILGVIAAPITSGDTALRCARLIAADFLNLKQDTIKRRMIICIPIFAITFIIMLIDFAVLWRYFAWCNQTLSVFTLWAITVWLARHAKPYIITLIPAIFMTIVTISYILMAKSGFSLNYVLSVSIGCVTALLFTILFYTHLSKLKHEQIKD